jgi:hypothetical protein
MLEKRELLIVFVLAFVVAALSGYLFSFPLRFYEPVVCIQMIGVTCTPYKILWANALLDLLFWFVILLVGWWFVRNFRAVRKE